MAKLTTKARNKIPSEEFGMPKEKKYPMPDKNHARNAKARASQMVNESKISKGEEVKIDKKADKILGKKDKSPMKESKKPKKEKKEPKLMSMHGGSMGKATYDDLDED